MGFNFNNKGLWDWWMQRVSSMLISVFSVPLLGAWYFGYLPTERSWYVLLESDIGRILTVVGLIGFAMHTRIGLWVVCTDYLPRSIQVGVSWLIELWVLLLLVWGLYLIWVF